MAQATIGAAILLAVSGADAADPLAGKRFSLDVFQGPILAGSDVIGIAGAYAGVAEGTSGFVVNAASPAVRDANNVNDLSWDLSPSISVPIHFSGVRDDFDDSGLAGQDYTDFIHATISAQLQIAAFGFGLDADIQNYSISSASTGTVTTSVTLGRYHALVAYRLLGDQLMMGGGARVTTLSITPHDHESSLTMVGASPELGFLVRPDWQSFRVGGTVRFPVHGGFLGGARTTSGGLVLPGDVVLPLEIELGAALQVGPRPFNPKWIDPREEEASLHRAFLARQRAREATIAKTLAVIADPLVRASRQAELEREEEARVAAEARDEVRLQKALEDERKARATNWPREHLLITGELLVSGSVDQGVGLRGFVGQNQPDTVSNGLSTPGSSGASVNYSPRFGVETEPIPGRMHVRTGTYYEPNRFGRSVGRQHFTFGSDVRLFSTTWFDILPRMTYRAQAYADFSPRYQSVSVGLGVWH